MNTDQFTLQTIVSYCDIDTKLIMLVICKQFNMIDIADKNTSMRYKNHEYIKMKRLVDDGFNKAPLFFTFTDTELTSIRIDLPEQIDFNYDLPEEEFDYVNNKFWGSMRVINFPKLITLLRSTNIGEKKIQAMIKESSRFIGELDLPIYKPQS